MKYKLFLFVTAIFIYGQSISQVKEAVLQASGLTCALCAKSIFTNLSSLPFVDNVDTDLNASSFLIRFKPDSEVDPQQLRKKVEDAGFFVSELQLQIQLKSESVTNDGLIAASGSFYQFSGGKLPIADGMMKVQLIEKEFLSAKEYKKITSGQKTPYSKEAQTNVYRVRVIK